MIHEWLQGRLSPQAYSMFSNHAGSLSCNHSNNSLTNRHMDIHRVFKNGKNHWCHTHLITDFYPNYNTNTLKFTLDRSGVN